MLRPLDDVRAEKTMFRPPGNVSQAAGFLEKIMYAWGSWARDSGWSSPPRERLEVNLFFPFSHMERFEPVYCDLVLRVVPSFQ